jgi:hypothetical protein
VLSEKKTRIVKTTDDHHLSDEHCEVRRSRDPEPKLQELLLKTEFDKCSSPLQEETRCSTFVDLKLVILSFRAQK